MKNNKIIKVAGSIFLSGFILSNVSYATEVKKEKVEVKSEQEDSDYGKIIEIAEKQRVLSHEIAKAYIYAGSGVAVFKNKKEIQKSIQEMKRDYEEIKNSTNQEKIKNLLTFFKMTMDEYFDAVKEPFSIENAQIVIDLSESLVEASQYVVEEVLKTHKIKKGKLIKIAELMSAEAQRISKYYMAYQAGIKDESTIKQANSAVEDFSKNLEILLKNPSNSPEVNKRLNKVKKLWSVVDKFYKDIEGGGLPLIVYNTSNQLSENLNKVAKLYEK